MCFSIWLAFFGYCSIEFIPNEIDRKPQANRSNSVKIYEYTYLLVYEAIWLSLIRLKSIDLYRLRCVFWKTRFRYLAIVRHCNLKHFKIIIRNWIYMDTCIQQSNDRSMNLTPASIHLPIGICYFQFVCIIFYRFGKKIYCVQFEYIRSNEPDRNTNDKLFRSKLSFWNKFEFQIDFHRFYGEKYISMHINSDRNEMLSNWKNHIQSIDVPMCVCEPVSDREANVNLFRLEH